MCELINQRSLGIQEGGGTLKRQGLKQEYSAATPDRKRKLIFEHSNM